MNQITMQWINEKMGALYISNMQLVEEVQRLATENEELKAKKDEKPE